MIHTDVKLGPGMSIGEPEAPPASPSPKVDSAHCDLPLTVIEARSGWVFANISELWRYRELLFFIAWRDVKIRYKQTGLGVAWAVVQPLTTMAVFTLFLGKAAGVRSGIEHYELFVFSGMVAWTFFSNTVTTASNSVVANERLVTKVYFPRIIIPLSTIGVGLFDLTISSALLGIMSVCYGLFPGWSVLMIPAVVIMLSIGAAGIGIFLSALIVAQRDFKYVLSFGVQLWMFATPCIYMSNDAFGPTARTLLPLNPAYGLVMGFRQAALGSSFDWYAFGVSSLVGILFAIVGLLYFRRVERSFADTI